MGNDEAKFSSHWLQWKKWFLYKGYQWILSSSSQVNSQVQNPTANLVTKLTKTVAKDFFANVTWRKFFTDILSEVSLNILKIFLNNLVMPLAWWPQKFFRYDPPTRCKSSFYPEILFLQSLFNFINSSPTAPSYSLLDPFVPWKMKEYFTSFQCRYPCFQC